MCGEMESEAIRCARDRAATCESCEHNDRPRGGVRLYLADGQALFRVVCKRCGCGNVSLLHGRCPENKWVSLTATKSAS